jgi:hypothetical protein
VIRHFNIVSRIYFDTVLLLTMATSVCRSRSGFSFAPLDPGPNSHATRNARADRDQNGGALGAIVASVTLDGPHALPEQARG